MTRTATEAPRAAIATTRPAAATRTRRPVVTTAAVVLAVVVLALVARLVGVERSYDLFVDEATYTEIAQTSSLSHGTRLHGEPFVLHPPLGLLTMGAVHALDATDDRTTALLRLRPASALAGAAAVGVLVALLWSTGARRWAVATGVLLALDPFTIRFDSLVMLEPWAQLAAVTAVACTARVVARPSGARAVAAAAAVAVTLGTKETFGLVVLGTVVLTTLLVPGTARRHLVAVCAGAVGGYALVNAAMALWAGPATWWDMRVSGLHRLLGLHQPTGFNSPDVDVTLWDRLLPNLADVGATYAVLALGGVTVLAVVVVEARAGRLRRTAATPAGAVRLVVLVWAATACTYLAYATLFGSLEEQMFHIAVTPCACALALVAQHHRAAVGVVAVVVVAQVVTWAHVRTTPDDTHLQAYRWFAAEVPAGARVAVTDDVSQFLLTGHELTSQGDPAGLRAERVRYVVVSPRLATQGYGTADADLLPWLDEHATLLLDVRGRDSDLQVWDLGGAP